MDSKKRKAMAGTMLTAMGTTAAAGAGQTSASFSDWLPHNYFKPDNYDNTKEFVDDYLKGKKQDTTKGWLKLAVATLGTAVAAAASIGIAVAAGAAIAAVAVPTAIAGGTAAGLSVTSSLIGKWWYGSPTAKQCLKVIKDQSKEIKSLKGTVNSQEPANIYLQISEKKNSSKQKLYEINTRLTELSKKINNVNNAKKLQSILSKVALQKDNYEKELDDVTKKLNELDSSIQNLNLSNSKKSPTKITPTDKFTIESVSSCNKQFDNLNEKINSLESAVNKISTNVANNNYNEPLLNNDN